MLFPDHRDAPAEQIQHVLGALRRHMRMDVGFVSEFVDRRRVFRFADAAHAGSPIVVGRSDPLEDSFCQFVVDGRLPPLMADAAADPVAARMPVTKALPIGAHLSAPIRLEDGRLFGTLCCFSAVPDPSLNARDLDVLRMCSDIVARLIENSLASRAGAQEKTQRIEAIIAARALAMVYQPIYRLADDRLVGFEALARFGGLPQQGPDGWFSDAREVGLELPLEFLAAGAALEGLPRLPAGSFLSVNLSPAALLSDRFAPLLDRMPIDRVIVELTEHAAIDSYADIVGALAPFRARGLRLAVDDIGAGHSSFRHVLELRPDMIKLDMSLTRAIDADPLRVALADSITRFGRRMGCEVVAEGVETSGELHRLREVGVTSVQGFLTGAPMPLADASALHPRGRFAAPRAPRAARRAAGA